MNLNLILSVCAVLVALTSFLFTFYTYKKHDKKLKRQEDQINEFNLKKLRQEEEDSSRAYIEANLIRRGKGRKIVKIYNKGKATAREVKVSLLEEEKFAFIRKPSIMDIKPQNSIDIIFIATNETPGKLSLQFEWNDDYKNNNKDQQTIPI